MGSLWHKIKNRTGTLRGVFFICTIIVTILFCPERKRLARTPVLRGVMMSDFQVDVDVYIPEPLQVQVEVLEEEPSLDVDISIASPIVSVVSIEPPVISVVDVLPTGPRGPRGFDGAGSSFLEAGMAVSALKVIVLTDPITEYASNDDSDHVDAGLGFTVSAAGTGDQVTVITVGEHEELSWTWTPGEPLFLGTNGALTQTAPTGVAVLQRVGTAVSPTRILFNPHPAFSLI